MILWLLILNDRPLILDNEYFISIKGFNSNPSLLEMRSLFLENVSNNLFNHDA